MTISPRDQNLFEHENIIQNVEKMSSCVNFLEAIDNY